MIAALVEVGSADSLAGDGQRVIAKLRASQVRHFIIGQIDTLENVHDLEAIVG